MLETSYWFSMCMVEKNKPTRLQKGVDKTRSTEHSRTCQNIPENPGTSQNMKKKNSRKK